jgi:hypothetical protein
MQWICGGSVGNKPVKLIIPTKSDLIFVCKNEHISGESLTRKSDFYVNTAVNMPDTLGFPQTEISAIAPTNTVIPIAEI